MPSFGCFCGQIIPLGSVPSKHTSYMISEKDLFAVRDLLYAAEEGSGESLQLALQRLAFGGPSSDLTEIIACPKCERLIMLSTDGKILQRYAHEPLPEL